MDELIKGVNMDREEKRFGENMKIGKVFGDVCERFWRRGFRCFFISRSGISCFIVFWLDFFIINF